MVVRSFLIIALFSIGGSSLFAQLPPQLRFDAQPELKQGIPIEKLALYYQPPFNDLLQPVSEIVKQPFMPSTLFIETKFNNNRQMEQTSQVVWLQFRIANAHPADTLRLLYSGGIHAYLSLYLKKNGSFQQLGTGGMCTAQPPHVLGKYALPLVVAPLTTNHYFVKVTDHLLLFDEVAGAIHTTQSYQTKMLAEATDSRWLFFVMAIIIGCMFLMCLYSFYQFYLGRDKAFLYYAIYAALAGSWILKFANPRFDLGLTPASLAWLAHPWSLSFSHILSLAYALFLAKILSIPGEQPKLWRIIRPLMFLLGLLQFMVVVQLFTGILFTSSKLFFLLDTIPSLIMGILLIIATVRSVSKLKPFLLVGAISLYVISLSPIHGVFLFEGASPQLASFINYPPFFMALGLFVELFCFLLALAYRNKLVEVDKNSLQRNYAIKLETEIAQRSHEIKEQSQQIEQQHAGQLKLAFERKLAEMEMAALRAQMNPHFIFNCLNSIKLYTIENDSQRASAYLTKFSRLIRLVLENSRSEKVTLKNELNALELYLQLEAMRFKDKLHFIIHVEAELDADSIEIPPMLLQPYVENAIWHGLMHKREGGSVLVKVVALHEDCLQVRITDDGIGRANAAGLKSKSVTSNKSFGMKVTGERISIINQLYHTNTQVAVKDLVDSEGNAAGTEVILNIPI